MLKKPHVPPAVALITILLASSGDSAIVIGHLPTQFDGVVVTRTEDVHYPPWTRTRARKYVIRESDGRERVYYADPSEGELDGFPIGATISKQRWHLD